MTDSTAASGAMDLVLAVRENAATEAHRLEVEALQLEERAAQMKKRAGVLRALDLVAQQSTEKSST